MKVRKTVIPNNLPQIICDDVRHRVASGELKPGDRVLEAQIATELEVSRTPVREAMVALVNEGLLVFVPRKGTYVRRYVKEEYLVIFDVREVLEGLAARLACENVTEETIEHLTQTNKTLQDTCTILAEKNGDEKALLFDKFREYDIEFHRTVMQKSGNTFLRERIATLYFIIESLVIAYDGPYLERFAKTVREHAEIIGHLEAGAADESERAVRHHIRDGKRFFNERIQISGPAQ